jgi:NADH:ubiquinone reductase (H+-translocating)
MKMPGLNRKVRIATDWLLHLLFPPELAQTKVAFESGIRNQHFEPGDVIFQQGDLGDSVYVIEEGECEVLHERNDEQELLATLNRGECFGEMALISDRTRNATIRARNATNVLIIPKADFNKLRQSVPVFGEVFSELFKRRSVEGAPHSFPETAGCCGHPIPIPTPESELGPPPGTPTGDWGSDSGQAVILQH